MNCPTCRRPIPVEEDEDPLTLTCDHCNTRFRVKERPSSPRSSAKRSSDREEEEFRLARPPRRRLAPGTKVGLLICIVPLTIVLLGVLWFVVWGGHQRRISVSAAQQFLEDLLVAERVSLAYQRCSERFRSTYPESTLRKYSPLFPRNQLGDFTLVGTTMTTSHQEGQVRFSCRFQSTRRLLIFVDMSKSKGAWLVDGFGFYEP
jgi:hypothetical protein